MTGIIAGLSMILVLVSGTGFIGYLPVPVLTAIVISALMGPQSLNWWDVSGRLIGKNV